MTVRNTLKSALDEEMSADPKVFLMGEECKVKSKSARMRTLVLVLTLMMLSSCLSMNMRALTAKMHANHEQRTLLAAEGDNFEHPGSSANNHHHIPRQDFNNYSGGGSGGTDDDSDKSEKNN